MKKRGCFYNKIVDGNKRIIQIELIYGYKYYFTKSFITRKITRCETFGVKNSPSRMKDNYFKMH